MNAAPTMSRRFEKSETHPRTLPHLAPCCILESKRTTIFPFASLVTRPHLTPTRETRKEQILAHMTTRTTPDRQVAHRAYHSRMRLLNQPLKETENR